MAYNMRILKGNIYVEGIDGSGKSTLAKELYDRIGFDYIAGMFEGITAGGKNIIVPIIKDGVRKYGLNSDTDFVLPYAKRAIGDILDIDDHLHRNLENYIDELRDFSQDLKDIDQDKYLKQKSAIKSVIENFNYRSNPFINRGIIANFFQEAMLEDVNAATFYVDKITHTLSNLSIYHPNFDGSQDIVFVCLEFIDRSPVSTFIYNCQDSKDVVMMQEFDRRNVASTLFFNLLSLYYLYNKPASIKDADAELDAAMKLGFNLDDIDFAQRDKYVDMFISEDGRLEQELNEDYKNLIIEKIGQYSQAMHKTVKSSVYEFSMLLYISVNSADEWEIVTDRLASRVKPTDILSSFEDNLEKLRDFAKQYYDLLSPKNNALENVNEIRSMVFKENNPTIVTQSVNDADLTFKFEKQIREELYKNLYYLLGEENVRPKIYTGADFSRN